MILELLVVRNTVQGIGIVTRSQTYRSCLLNRAVGVLLGEWWIVGVLMNE
jgi:hypothetical protein